MKIDRYHLDRRLLPEKTLEYYDRTHKFGRVKKDDDEIPILESAMEFIERKKLEYPYGEYIKGFKEQYDKGLPLSFIDNEATRTETVLKTILKDRYSPAISFRQPGNIPYFSDHEAYKYGRESAILFLAWEKVFLTPVYFKEAFAGNDSEPERKQPVFQDLFRDPDKAKQVDRIFEDNEYTKEGRWICSGKKNKLATAFYVLKDEFPEICVIKPGNKSTQLRVFYKHYGINAAYKGGDVTLKNLTKRPEYFLTDKPDYKEFTLLFAELK